MYGVFHRTERGFTLMETIAALMLLAILSVAIVSRGASTTAYTLASEAEILKAHLRYAHYRAMSDTEPWGMAFEAGSYSLLKNLTATGFVPPNEDGPAHMLGSGITITTGAGSSVNFNEWGNPTDAGGGPLTADKSIVLSDGSATRTITITQNTGFIP